MVISPANWCQPKNSSSPSKRCQFFGLGLLALLVLMGTFYVVSINSLSTKGYEIKKLRADLENVKQSSHKLELEANNLQSLKTIESGLDQSSFVAVQRIEYLSDVGTSVGVAVK